MLFEAAPPNWVPVVQAVAAAITAAGVIAIFCQAAVAWWRHKAQTEADRERRIIESFAKAVEQLGNDKQLATRLGGIYTLERISQESERDYWPIMETLTAFVRENAPNPFADFMAERKMADAGPAAESAESSADIKAVLAVLGRRKQSACRKDKEARRRLDLTATSLRGISLEKAQLQDVILVGARLERINLSGANLQDAKLDNVFLRRCWITEANFEGANLWWARLEGANLWKVNLKRANLSMAHLQGAHLCRAHLEGANLQDVDLKGAILTEAIGLTKEQLAKAYGDEHTVVDPDLRPEHWPPAASE